MKRLLLGDIASIASGGTPSRSNPEFWGGDIPWVKTGEVQFNRIKDTDEKITHAGVVGSATKIFPKYTLLMAMYGQGKTRGQVAILEIDAAVNQACAAITLQSSEDTAYLYHYLAFNYQNIRKLSNSGSQENLSADLIRSIPVHYPSQVERRKIADILSTWDEALEKLDALIAAKDRRKQAIMQQLLTGRKRVKGFTEKWKAVTLGDVLDPVIRPAPKPSTKFLAAGIRSHGKGVFLKPDFSPDDIALDELFELRAGDLVVNITFAWEGAAAIVSSEANGALVSHRFPTFEFVAGKSERSFFRHYILSKRFVFDCGLASPGGAGRNRVLSKSAFLGIELRLPSAKEQQRIGEILDSVADEIGLLRRQRSAIDQQKRGLMQRLLTGKIRVTPETE